MEGQAAPANSILWTIQNTSLVVTAGPAVQMTGGADNNTLQYLMLKSSDGIAASGTVFLSCINGTMSNTGDVIQYCDIGPNGTAYPSNGICAYGLVMVV